MKTRSEERVGQRGSLPLALLVALIVGGLAVVLVARIVATQSLVRFDEAFHGALPTADAGVNLGKFWLNNGTMLKAAPGTSEDGGDCGGTYSPSDFPVGCTTVEEDRQIDGAPYTFWLTRVSQRDWEITSRGVATSAVGTEVMREVVGTISERPLVNVALFAENLITFAGNNAADSYTSDINVPQEDSWCTGSGYIATNGDIDLSGTSGGPCHTMNRTVDRVMLHNADPADPDDPGYPIENATETYPGGDRCVHAGGGEGANCREVSPESPTYLEPEIFGEPLDYGTQRNVEFIQDAIDDCTPEVNGTYSTGSGVLGVDTLNPGEIGLGTHDAGDKVVFPGDVEGPYHCFGSLYFDAGNTKILGDADEPVIIVVEGSVVLKGQGGGKGGPAHIGCENTSGDAIQCVAGDPTGDGASRPDARRLWIFTNGDVDLGTDSAYAGVMWAPRSNCLAGAQGDVYGSLICGSLPENLGGWKFHYDETLFTVSSGEFFTSAWEERFID